jgi:hypothetical protein
VRARRPSRPARAWAYPNPNLLTAIQAPVYLGSAGLARGARARGRRADALSARVRASAGACSVHTHVHGFSPLQQSVAVRVPCASGRAVCAGLAGGAGAGWAEAPGAEPRKRRPLTCERRAAQGCFSCRSGCAGGGVSWGAWRWAEDMRALTIVCCAAQGCCRRSRRTARRRRWRRRSWRSRRPASASRCGRRRARAYARIRAHAANAVSGSCGPRPGRR